MFYGKFQFIIKKNCEIFDMEIEALRYRKVETTKATKTSDWLDLAKYVNLEERINLSNSSSISRYHLMHEHILKRLPMWCNLCLFWQLI